MGLASAFLDMRGVASIGGCPRRVPWCFRQPTPLYAVVGLGAVIYLYCSMGAGDAGGGVGEKSKPAGCKPAFPRGDTWVQILALPQG